MPLSNGLLASPHRSRWCVLTIPLLVLAGCDPEEPPEVLEPVPAPVPRLPAPDDLADSPELRTLVEWQMERDGEALTEALGSPEPAVRARAAFALASVQHPDAGPELEDLLADTVPSVRLNAAFALGQIPLPDGAEPLIGALRREEAPEVRLRLLDAVGKRGAPEDLDALVAMGEDGGVSAAGEEAVAFTLALARAALRDIRAPVLVEALLARLVDPDADVRAAAAYYFGTATNAETWRGSAEAVRFALDGYGAREEAAMRLVQALGRLADVENDTERLIHWLETGGDWRIRANAAMAMRSPEWVTSPAVRAGLFDALHDRSGHVRVGAAGSLSLALWDSEEALEQAEAWVQGSEEEWRSQIVFVSPLAGQGRDESVIDWTRRMADHHPVPAARGAEVLTGIGGPDAVELLFDLAEHPEPGVRASAVRTLSQRRTRDITDPEEIERLFDLLADRLQDEAELPAARAAEALDDPAFAPLGASELLEEFGPEPERDAPTSGDLPFRDIDWTTLEELGPRPTVVIETERGEMLVRLIPEQAPLAVLAFVDEVRRGRHDGVPFHRVVPNFVIQGGDVTRGDGTGTPGYRLRSEFTHVPFRRGVLAMASSGKDTEGAQFFLAHSAQPHLEGGYTSFGWLEEGADVLDVIQEGDRVIRMRVESENGT